jgi:hypothetical protein
LKVTEFEQGMSAACYFAIFTLNLFKLSWADFIFPFWSHNLSTKFLETFMEVSLSNRQSLFKSANSSMLSFSVFSTVLPKDVSENYQSTRLQCKLVSYYGSSITIQPQRG